jgi:photosystem II stability/assembly factor-like uncharacterized protein
MRSWTIREVIGARFSAARSTITLGALLLGSAANAGVNELSAIGPDGGRIIDVSFDSAGSVVYLAASSGFHRSTDGGRTWRRTKGDFVQFPADIAADPASSERLYVAAGEQFLVSSDGGLTFTQTSPSGRRSSFLRVDTSRDGNVVYLPDGARMYRSTDHGASWQERGAFPVASSHADAIAVDPSDPAVVYVSLFDQGILVSRDSGATWQPVSSDPSVREVVHIAIDPSNPQCLWAATTAGLLRSLDGGTSWQARNLPADHYAHVAIDPSNPQIVFVTQPARGTVLRTVDAGEHWAALSQQVGPGLSGVIMHPVARSNVVVFSGDGVWLSADGGEHWVRGNDGIVATSIDRIARIEGTDRAYLAARSSGIHALSSEGTTQAINNAGLYAALDPAIPSARDVVASPGTSNTNPDTLVAIAGIVDLARSLDGGEHWSRVARPSPAAAPRALALTGGAQPVLYVATSEGVWSSLDFGDTWTAVSAGLPAGEPAQSVHTSASALVLYAVVGERPNAMRLFRSSDGAQTWQSAALDTGNISAFAVDPRDPLTVYVALNEVLRKSRDGGASFSGPLPMGQALRSIAVDPLDSRVVYAVDDSRTLRSIDAGTSWELLAVSQNRWSSTNLVVAPDFHERDAILVGTDGSGLMQLTIRPDLEVTMTAPNSMTANTSGAFGLEVKNLGPYSARDVRVTVQLPANAANVSASTLGGTCTVGAQRVQCDYASLSANAKASVVLSATAPTEGTFRATAVVSSAEGDGVVANNSATASTAVSTRPPASDNVATPTAGGSGGGGAMSWLMALALGMLAWFACRKRCMCTNRPCALEPQG